MNSPANLLVRAVLVEQLRLGQLLSEACEARHRGELAADQLAISLREHLGRFDALLYALAVTCPNYRELCETVGILESEIEQSLARVGADLDACGEMAAMIAADRVQAMNDVELKRPKPAR